MAAAGSGGVADDGSELLCDDDGMAHFAEQYNALAASTGSGVQHSPHLEIGGERRHCCGTHCPATPNL
jgi:hypothetical protein